MSEKYIYEIQAFSYSQFEHHILLHTKQFSKTEFRKMIEIARQKAKELQKNDDDFFWRYNYPNDVVSILEEDFGFVRSDHLIAHVGCTHDDICRVEKE